jgi:hypothetical protein
MTMPSEWVLVSGQLVDFGGAVALMDGELRAELKLEWAPCAAQWFMDAYAAAHLTRFGVVFGIGTFRSE